LCTIFGDNYICLLTNRKMIKIVTQDSDWFTYCIDIWLLTLLFGHALEMTIHFYYPTFYSFIISNLLLTQNFVYPTLFSSVPSPARIMTAWSLRWCKSAFQPTSWLVLADNSHD
jgi:hypothetical protein